MTIDNEYWFMTYRELIENLYTSIDLDETHPAVAITDDGRKWEIYLDGPDVRMVKEIKDESILEYIADVFVEKTQVLNEKDISTIKSDTALELISLIMNRLSPLLDEYSQMCSELDKQIVDLNHMIYGSKISGKNANDSVMYQDLEDATVLRRTIKDAMTIANHFMTQMKGCKTVINSMDNRIYTPRSKKYSNIGILKFDIETDEDYIKHLSEQYIKLRDMVRKSNSSSDGRTTINFSTPKEDGSMI